MVKNMDALVGFMAFPLSLVIPLDLTLSSAGLSTEKILGNASCSPAFGRKEPGPFDQED